MKKIFLANIFPIGNRKRRKILEILGATTKVEWKENFREKVSKDLGTPREFVLLLKILENAVPLIR